MEREPLRALILEDCEDDALLVVRELGQQGFDVTWERAWTAFAMKSFLDAKSWDVVLSDYNMPGFDAPEALLLLQESGRDLPFIVISGTVGEEAAVAAMKNGAHDYLQKGNLTRLGQAIEREVRESQFRRERQLGIEKIEHLNRVLRAIRKVNQLTTTEKDPARLIEKTCDLLVETRGYVSAICVSFGRDQKPEFVGLSAVGDDRTSELAETIRVGGLTSCMKRALGSVDTQVIESDAPECGGCPLNPQHLGRQRLARALIHDGRAYGLLGIALPDGFELNEEEVELFGEVAGDIAFALHGIEQEEIRQLAEIEIRSAKNFLDNVINAIADPVFVKDDNRRFVLVNEALCGIVGRSRENLLGEDGDDMLSKDQVTVFRKRDFAVLETGEENLNEEVLSDLSTNEVHTIVTRKTRYIDPVGKRFLVGVIRDVSDLKHLQAQIAQSDRLASMGMLAAGVAHEINNPLTYVLYNLESLVEDLPRLTSANCIGRAVDRLGHDEWDRLVGSDGVLLNPVMLEDIRSRVDDALSGAHRIKKISRGLGTFSRVEKDRMVPVNLMHVIDVAIGMAFNEIKYRARLTKDYGRVAKIMASDGKLSQVFLNLLMNAAHAIAEGDVDGNQIRVRTWQEGDVVLAQVSDTGRGISPEDLPHVFEPFFTTKKVGAGTGLGLSISKSIVEEYGGSIEVTSEVGVGTTFVVRFLVKTVDEGIEKAPVAHVRSEPPIRGRILVIDDERGIRVSIARMLKGHEVVEADSGEAGKAIIETDCEFDVVLCDMMMPTMSGVDLHEWLVCTHPDLAKKVVFVTGGAFTPRTREYLKEIDNLRLEKPFDVALLRSAVNELVLAGRIADDLGEQGCEDTER